MSGTGSFRNPFYWGFLRSKLTRTQGMGIALPLAGSGSLDLSEHVALLALLLRVIGHVASRLQLPVLLVHVQADGGLAHNRARVEVDFSLGSPPHGQLHDLPVGAVVVVVLLIFLQ